MKTDGKMIFPFFLVIAFADNQHNVIKCTPN